MKRLLFFLTIFILFGVIPATAIAEEINDFDIEIKVLEDGSFDVTETIVYDFGIEQRQGIYREIPYKYEARGRNYVTDISNILVTDDFGKTLTTQVSNSGGYKRIRIGDEGVYVSDEHTYVIKYTVKDAMNYFESYDEIYWNATGDEWNVPIKDANVKVILPQEIQVGDLQVMCFSGSFGSSEICERFDALSGGSRKDLFFAESNLASKEGLTIVVGIPKGVVAEPTLKEFLLDVAKDNLIVLLPFIVLLLMYYHWRSRGKDPLSHRAIIARYSEPDNLTPGQVGTLVDEWVQSRDISADIIYLATLGYLKINRLEKKILLFKSTDYEIVKLKPGDDIKELHLKKLYLALFSNTQESVDSKYEYVTLSDLKKTFYKEYKDISDALYKSLVLKKYFAKNPLTTRIIYFTGGMFFIPATVGLLATLDLISFLAILCVVLSGLVIVGFGFVMPQKTKKGVEAYEHVLGLKEYLTVAEKERLKFHNAPEKKPEVFEKLLPFAIALQVEKQWAEQFKDIFIEEPSWYHDPAGGAFNAVIFTSSINSFTSTANNTMAAQQSTAAGGGSGFSGGGFSGGGFSGGGGGSW